MVISSGCTDQRSSANISSIFKKRQNRNWKKGAILNCSILALFLAVGDQIQQLCKWVILANFEPVLAREGPCPRLSPLAAVALLIYSHQQLCFCALEQRAEPLLCFHFRPFLQFNHRMNIEKQTGPSCKSAAFVYGLDKWAPLLLAVDVVWGSAAAKMVPVPLCIRGSRSRM